jgi:hypothetical protein
VQGSLEEGVMKKRLLTALVVLTGLFLMSASIVCAQAAPVAKTGQTSCYDAAGSVISCAGTGQDGDLQKGVASPSPRFTDNSDGTVTDNLTGLMWAKDANIFGYRSWSNALSDANNLSLGLEGCSTNYTDWRLPNSNELQTLIDKSNFNPALPSGHPFLNVQTSFYWSSTTYAYYTSYAWSVYMYYGDVGIYIKTNYNYVWPVRSDN